MSSNGLTPSKIIQMLVKRCPKSLQRYTMEPTFRHELLINGHGKTIEETIQELKRTIQGLQEELEHVKVESSKKEKQLTNSFMSLNLEHNVQLKHKNDFKSFSNDHLWETKLTLICLVKNK